MQEYQEQKKALEATLKSAEAMLPEIRLDIDNTMNYLITSVLLDCPEAIAVLLEYIASDFASFSAHTKWQSPLIGPDTYRKLMALVPASAFASASAPPASG